MKTKNILRFSLAIILFSVALAPPAIAQSGLDPSPSPIMSPTIPAGPRPTATVTPLQSLPEPTATVTPLASASPAGTQPQTSNTVAPSPPATPAGTAPPQTTNTVAPSPSPTSSPTP